MSRRIGLGAAGVLVILTNFWILGGVALNRRNPPEAVLLLTEREVPLRASWKGEEDSSLALSLKANLNSTSWITDAKLRDWGYDPEAIRKKADLEKDRYIEIPKKELFLVLEMEGEGWTRWVQEMEKKCKEELKNYHQLGKID